MSNSTLTNSKGFHSPTADLSIVINRRDLEQIMSGLSTFPALVSEGKVTLEGDATILQSLQELLVEFTADFELLPGTSSAPSAQAGDSDVFEQPQPASSAGG
jgi:alkyl sulfatase BDS1-like metallo-beta-lactamase superfamily hydrolase